jgi:hypothetical protein
VLGLDILANEITVQLEDRVAVFRMDALHTRESPVEEPAPEATQPVKEDQERPRTRTSEGRRRRKRKKKPDQTRVSPPSEEKRVEPDSGPSAKPATEDTEAPSRKKRKRRSRRRRRKKKKAQSDSQQTPGAGSQGERS